MFTPVTYIVHQLYLSFFKKKREKKGQLSRVGVCSVDNPDHCCTNLVEKETISTRGRRLAGGGSSGNGDGTWPRNISTKGTVKLEKRQVLESLRYQHNCHAYSSSAEARRHSGKRMR